MDPGLLHIVFSTSVVKPGAAAVLSLLLLLAVSLANDDHDVAKQLRNTHAIVPVERILQTRNRRGPLRVLEITLQETQGHFVYTVEYVDAHGVVWQRQYEATSGVLWHVREGSEDEAVAR